MQLRSVSCGDVRSVRLYDPCTFVKIHAKMAILASQSRSYGGQAANFCVGGKIGRKAGKSGSMPPKNL